MSTRATDTMTRLGAADPARDLHVDEDERARVWRLIAAAPPADGTPKRPRARLQRAQLRLALIPVLLVLSAGPLAASGVIRIGGPADAGSRFSTPPHRAQPVPGAVRLLPLTPRPSGGQPWGPGPELGAVAAPWGTATRLQADAALFAART